ncbi:uncharacterized protein EMH_0079240 [Eimeria mitis]|uniref:Uncharacterized protein n=1 Tax=Eimeria mitis TaxID=44415 RepID=U6JNF0_9EIME|nr:uncharacterized protein EMH_0079240 [Eimeria mitis]CDJ27044.1 hypothetical protein, conserved [Eimeria mitis]
MQSASFLDSSLEAIDAVPDDARTLGMAGTDVEVAAKNHLPKSKVKGYRRTAVATGLGAALALLLCLFLVRAGVQRRAGPKADLPTKKDSRIPSDATGEAGVSMREDRATDKSPSATQKTEAERRLEELQRLLPSASRLASAVDSSDAQRLLAAVKEYVDPEDQFDDTLLDRRKPSDRLDRALETLRRLHQTAATHAEGLAKNGAESRTFSMVDSKEEALALLSTIEDREAEDALLFVDYLRLLDRSISNMCRQFGEARGELSSVPRFVDEMSGESLISLANKVEWLKDLANKKARTVDTAFQMETSMLFAIKAHIYGLREARLLHLESQLGIARALMAAAEGDNGANRDKETQVADPKQSSRLPSLSEKLASAEAVLVKLRNILQSPDPHITLSDILSASRNADDLEAQADDLLVKCWTLALDHRHPEECLDPRISNMLKDVALKANWRAVQEMASLRVALRNLQTTKTGLQGSPEASDTPPAHLNTILSASLLKSGEETYAKAEKYYSEIKSLLEALHGLRETKHLVSQVQKATATVIPMVTLTSKLYMLMLDNCLLKLLNMDIQSNIEIAERASSSRSTLSRSERGVLEDLEASFDAAKESARKATTIKGAIEAAARMREKAEAMESLLNKRRGPPHHH